MDESCHKLMSCVTNRWVMSQMYFYSGDLDALLYLGLGIKVGEFAAEWVVSQMNNHVTNE